MTTPGGDRPHGPAPSLWPVGFAVGVACILVGLIVSWPAVAVGAVIAVVFGLLWVRDATRDYRGVPEVEPERRTTPAAEPIPAHVGEAAMPEPEEGELERFPRNKFLEFSTLGLGAAIGGIVTLPPLGFMIVPSFIHQEYEDIDVGPLSNFPENQYVIATFLSKPDEGEVSRRTAYIRNNGLLGNQPSFTIISNRCAHLGCPVQPAGPVFSQKEKTVKTQIGGQPNEVQITPTLPAGGFSCPCHGGAYDTEGNRTAGPPVRSLDRYEYSIRTGHLILGTPYSVGKVIGTGKNAEIRKYRLAGPGEHVDGPEQWFYPAQPTQISS